MDKPHLKKINSQQWAVWRSRESSRYAIPVTVGVSPKKALESYKAYLGL